MRRTLTFAFSPCPNDTFMFHAVAERVLRLDDVDLEVHLHDVETLNELAIAGTYDISKVSVRAFFRLRPGYRLLDTGAALGFGCGPLVVARDPRAFRQMASPRVALPGELTTAHLLLQLWAPHVTDRSFVKYDSIMDAVLEGNADAGVIIHESRFMAGQAGLATVVDLGDWWEVQTGMPLPLGCIVARESLGQDFIAEVEDLLRQSIGASHENPPGAMPYVRKHASELSQDVIDKHIKTFVNDFSLSLGEKGVAAIERLESFAREKGVAL